MIVPQLPEKTLPASEVLRNGMWGDPVNVILPHHLDVHSFVNFSLVEAPTSTESQDAPATVRSYHSGSRGHPTR